MSYPITMHCPMCGALAPTVRHSGGRSFRGPFIRARKCPSCGYRFRTTDESGVERAITPLCVHGGIVGFCAECAKEKRQ